MLLIMLPIMCINEKMELIFEMYFQGRSASTTLLWLMAMKPHPLPLWDAGITSLILGYHWHCDECCTKINNAISSYDTLWDCGCLRSLSSFVGSNIFWQKRWIIDLCVWTKAKVNRERNTSKQKDCFSEKTGNAATVPWRNIE